MKKQVPGWMGIPLVIYMIAVLTVILLASCASLPTTEGMGPGGAIVAYDASGFTINADGYRHLKSEGVPDSDFLVVPLGYHTTNSQWHDAHEIQLNRPNAVPKGTR